MSGLANNSREVLRMYLQGLQAVQRAKDLLTEANVLLATIPEEDRQQIVDLIQRSHGNLSVTFTTTPISVRTYRQEKE